MRVSAILASTFLLLLASRTARAAEPAAYVDPAELPEEGTSHLLIAALVGSYARAVDAAPLGGVENVGAVGLRLRLHAFRPVSYCAGLDADLGGSDEGVVYAATAYVAGIGARWGAGNVVSLCGGAGVDGAAGGIPVGARFPAELATGFAVGPLRPSVWLRPAWVLGADARSQGTGVDFVDELETGLSVRIGRQHRYWSEVSAGGGPVVGFTYRRLMGADMIGGFIGVELGAEQ